MVATSIIYNVRFNIINHGSKSVLQLPHGGQIPVTLSGLSPSLGRLLVSPQLKENVLSLPQMAD